MTSTGRLRVTTILFLLLGLGSVSCSGPASQARPFERQVHWSATRPPVNLIHIFEGEINRRGRAVGYHSRPDGRDPVDARVVQIGPRPNRWGVYRAQVEIRDGPQSPWRQKRSTFFPDDWRRQDVIEAILNAYRHQEGQGDGAGRGPRFRGPSGRGFTIEGYLLNDGRINTAYPIYRRDRR